MWPLSIPSALKPGFAAAQGPLLTSPSTSCSGSRTLSQRSRAAAAAAAHSSRYSLDVTSTLLDTQRRSSLSAWPPAASSLTSQSACPTPTTLLLEPFNLPWSSNLPTTPEPDFPDTFPFPTTVPSPQQPQQVTRHNFHLALPLLTQALKDCTFFALDCEFSGLSPQAPHFSELYDDAADRYQRVLSSSKQFMVMQVGLSFFTKDPSSPAASISYTSHTFNFSIFPKPFGSSDRRFMCQASSLDFLASQGFDFNRFIYDGIPYVQLHERDCHLQDLGLFGFTPNGGPSPLPTPATPASMLEDFPTTGGFSQILELIRSSAKPVVLHNGVADLVYALQQFACPLPEQWNEFKPLAQSWFTGGVYDTKVLAGQLMSRLQVPGLFGDLSLGQLHRTLGSSGAVEALLRGQVQAQGSAPDVTLPRVAHAPGYSLYPDADAITPTTAAAVPGSAHGVAAVEPSCMMSSSSPRASAAATPAPASPRRPGHGAAAAAAHEAGYDAYMTGVVFARLAAAAELLVPASPSEQDSQAIASDPAPASTHPDQLPSSPLPDLIEDTPLAPSPSPSSLPASPLSSLRPWEGRLHSMRADLPYLNLLGADPIPHRPNVFFLTNLDLRTKVSLVTSKFAEAGLGKVRVTMLGQPGDAGAAKPGPTAATGGKAAAGSKSAFVQLLSPELVEQVLPAMKGMGVAWRALPYSEYHAAKYQAQQQQSGGQQQQQQPLQQQQQQKYTLVKVGPKGRDAAGGSAAGAEQGSKWKAGSRGGAERSAGAGAGAGPEAGPVAPGSPSPTPTKFITVVRRVAVPQAPLQLLGIQPLDSPAPAPGPASGLQPAARRRSPAAAAASCGAVSAAPPAPLTPCTTNA